MSKVDEMTKMESLGLLAGGIVHDFNNILQPIIGYSNLLLENLEAGTEEHLYLSTIADSARRAKDLVSQIMAFIQSSETVERAHNLVPVVREAIKLIRSTLPATISLNENVSDELIFVDCPPSQIHQVLMNLCANASQAIRDTGTIEITLDARELDNISCFDGSKLNGRHVRLAVSDNGSGMKSETLSQIFEPLFTTKGPNKGTGLGLSTVFGIVKNHGGGVWVSSELGSGSTFEVFLPLSEASIEKPPDIATSVRTHGTENILFVDDEDANTKLGKIILGRDGYNVTVASNGSQALEIFAASPERFDLVLTDQSMPNMTGATLAHELLKIRPGLPIILYSGYGEAVLSTSSESGETIRFLNKPITPNAMRRVVREALDRVAEVAPCD